MNTKVNITGTGGGRHIGLNACKTLAASGHVSVVDDKCVNGHREASIGIEDIIDALSHDEKIIFAYCYGSFTCSLDYKDIDLAVFLSPESVSSTLPLDISIMLNEHTGISPDFFDVKIINELLEKGDIFSLLYLKNVFMADTLLLDRDFSVRADFIEKYSMKYRECEGLFGEIAL